VNGPDDVPGIEQDWLAGEPMDPAAELPDPLPPLPGFPFCHSGTGVLISGPTGGGRSSLVQVCAYDAAKAGLRIGYLGSEVTYREFQARAAMFAELRGDEITDDLRQQLARVRYLELDTVMTRAMANPKLWVAGVAHAFDVVIGDPFSAIASATGLNFDQNNSEFATFYDRVVQPYVTSGGTFIGLENVGHALEAQERAKGASAKQDRADLTFSCKRHDNPEGLLLTAQKVRSIRAPFHRGDKWLFDRDTLTITSHVDDGPGRDPNWRPTVLMERISIVLEQQPGLGVTAVRESVNSKARNVDTALRYLIDDGYARLEQDGKTRRHYITKPYRSPDDVPTSMSLDVPTSMSLDVPDVPYLSHDVPSTMSRCPPPNTGGQRRTAPTTTNDVPRQKALT
jgi:hypothetical protein